MDRRRLPRLSRITRGATTPPARACAFRSRRTPTIPAKARTPVYPVPGALRPRLGVPRHAASLPTRCRRFRSSNPAPARSSTQGRSRGRATRRGRWRTSRTSATSRGCIPACWAIRSGRWCPTTRWRRAEHVLHYTIVRPEAPNSDEFQVFANTETVQAGAAQPIRAAPALHDRAQARLGRRQGHGLLLRVAARDHRAMPRLLHHWPELRLRRSRLDACRSSSA